MESRMNPLTIFLTGAGGVMGGAALEIFMADKKHKQNQFVVLDLPTKANKKKLTPYLKYPNVKIIWGDLSRYEDTLQAVNGTDYILHAAAVIPPAADFDPDLAERVNVGAVRNILRAIKQQPYPDRVKLVNIGSVAETGDRMPPIHVGRTGDPIYPSIYDVYATTKIEAERLVAESGLRRWVSLRQTFILINNVNPVPIMYHMPLQTCFEAISRQDAGRVLVNIVDPDLPDSFWRKFYNIGGGETMRSNYYTFLKRSMEAAGLDIMKIQDRSWFALQNFHCQWFEDSDLLETFLNFRTYSLDQYFEDLSSSISPIVKLAAKILPGSWIKHFTFRPAAEKRVDSPLQWIRTNPLRTAAFYKTRQHYEEIPSWDEGTFSLPASGEYIRLDHGYDETKPVEELDLADMQQAAVFRGGKCLSSSMMKGDIHHKLEWECCFGHTFEMAPNTVLFGGHWCPECSPPAWNYAAEARMNPFLAQVWNVHHERSEETIYPLECMYDLKTAPGK